MGYVLVLVLLAPAGVMFGQLWALDANAADEVAAEQAASAYARPANALLAALVAARSAAVRGEMPDDAEVRAAVREVDKVDHRYGELLRVGPRWDRLNSEIDQTLTAEAGGPGASNAYTVPVALAQALLTRIADSAQDTTAPAGSYQLIDVAMRRLPQVVTSADEVATRAAALADSAPGAKPPEPAESAESAESARTEDAEESEQPTEPADPAGAAPSDPRSAIAQDRIERTSDEVGALLRAGSGKQSGYVADLPMLAALDKFSAATSKLSQASAELGRPDGGTGGKEAADSVHEAGSRVREAALVLEMSVLDALDTQLAAQDRRNTAHQRLLWLAAALLLPAAGALLWLLRVVGGEPDTAADTDDGSGQRKRTGAAGSGSRHPEGTPALVGARAGRNPVGERAPRGRA